MWKGLSDGEAVACHALHIFLDDGLGAEEVMMLEAVMIGIEQIVL